MRSPSFAFVALMSTTICDGCVVASECSTADGCPSGFECIARECVEVAPPPSPPPCDADDAEEPCPDVGIGEGEGEGEDDPCGADGLDTGRCD